MRRHFRLVRKDLNGRINTVRHLHVPEAPSELDGADITLGLSSD